MFGAVVGFAFHSVTAAATGLFMEPLGKEFGWSRSVLSAGLSIASISTALLSPFFGVLIDRWGSRRLALPGIVLTTAVIASFSLLNGSILQWIALWTFYAFASLGIKSTIWTTAVAGVFTEARGLAIGVTMAGSAVAQIFTPPITNFLIDEYGWRLAFVALALTWGLPALLLNTFTLFDVHDRNKKAREAAAAAAAAAGTKVADAPPAIPLTGLSISEAWRSAALWKIATSTFLIMLLTIAVLVHQIPILTSAGVSRQDAAWLASLAGIAGIMGKLATGWCMDRWHARWVGGITLSLSSVAFIMLLEPFRTPALIVAAMFINGYASGSKLQIVGYLCTRYAGLVNFGAIFGVMASVIAIGTGFGPVIGGVIFDAYGSYTPLLLAGVVGCLVSGGLLMSLGPYPEFKPRPVEPQPT